MEKLVVNPTEVIRGEAALPGDKSVSHRAVIFSALGEGRSVIDGFLESEDCLNTVKCFRMLGIDIHKEGREWIVSGRGLHGLREPEDILDAGNSGTLIRLLSGVLAGQPFTSFITGDSSIRRRPMDRVAVPLRMMGATISGREGGSKAPLCITGGELRPIRYTLPVASAQVKSAILLAGLYASGRTVIEEPVPSRDHTERMLLNLGADIEKSGSVISIRGGARWEGRRFSVPGDISSAAFFLCAAAILPGSRVLLRDVGINPTRSAVIDVLRSAGAKIELRNTREWCGEPVADILCEAGELRPFTLRGDLIPNLIDEIPVLAVVAAFADGRSVIRDAAELKHKESDRIQAICSELGKLGIGIESLEDGLIIEGSPGRASGGAVESHGDHRIAMALAVAALRCISPVEINGAECINISFPGFADLLFGLSGQRAG